MQDALLFALLLFAATPTLNRQKLAADTFIQNYPCARGYAFFYPSGRLYQCAVSRETPFGNLLVPAGSLIVLQEDGLPHHVFLAHDTWLGPYHAMGGSLVGPSEGAVTGLYPGGQLRSLYLVSDMRIQGVPCRGGEWGFFTDSINGGNFVWFYENGRLRSCKVTEDYQGTPRGHRITLAP
jgi:hypothetical protein